MTDTRHINPEDLALHAMQLLSKDEAHAVHAHLQECAECRNEFMAAQDDLAIAAMTVDLETPSAQARERFMKQIAREKRVVPIDRGTATAGERAAVAAGSREPKQQGKLLPWLGWAVAAGLAFAAFNLYRERGQMQTTIADQSAQLQAETAQLATSQEKLSSLSADAARAGAIMETLTDSSAMRVTLNTTPAAKPTPQGRATYVAAKGTLVFIANNLDPLPPEKTYELWIIPANGSSPLAVGTFHPDARGNASVLAPKLPLGVEAKAFGVTIEPEGGSAGPTMPIILAGS